MFYNPHGFAFLKLDDSKLKRFSYKAIEKIMVFINPKCTIIGCSKGEFEEAKKISQNCVLIDNAINIGKLDQLIKVNNKEINFNDLKVCTVGRIGYQKNPREFNEIAKLLPNIKFTWIGDGELKEELTSKNIRITGWKERADALNLMNDQNIFILTSLWEGLPMTLLEAGYMKKLCIVSNVIGNRDVIKDKENGYIYNNIEDIKKIIKSINKENYYRIINKYYYEIINKYNAEKMVKKYEKQYEVK